MMMSVLGGYTRGRIIVKVRVCLVGVAGGSIIMVGLSLSDIMSERTAHSDEVVIA